MRVSAWSLVGQRRWVGWQAGKHWLNGRKGLGFKVWVPASSPATRPEPTDPGVGGELS